MKLLKESLLQWNLKGAKLYPKLKYSANNAVVEGQQIMETGFQL